MLKPGAYQCDHVNPDGLTGEPTFENARILCIPCHKDKTKVDVANIAKAKRREIAHVGAKRSTGKLSGPTFAKKQRTHEGRQSLPPKEMFK